MLLTLVASVVVCTPALPPPAGAGGQRPAVEAVGCGCVVGSELPPPPPAIEDAPAPPRWMTQRRDLKPVGLAPAAASPPRGGASSPSLPAPWFAGSRRGPGPRASRAPPRADRG